VEYLNTGASWTTDSTRLGTTVPRNRSSDFYTAGDWISADRPAWVDAAADSGETGRFSFTLTAPTVWTVTQYTEHWGLEQNGKGWFGPPDDEVYFQITVLPSGQPDSMIVDDEDPGCTITGAWSTSTWGNIYGALKHYKGPGDGSATATWTTPLPAPAECYVYFWVNNGGYANTAQYIVQHSSGADTLTGNQYNVGDGWHELGIWHFGTTATVTVTDKAWLMGTYVVADAIKFVYQADTTPPQAPGDLTIDLADGDIALDWSPVVQDTSGNPETISHYIIYRSPDPGTIPGDSIAGTTGTDYLDAGAAGSTGTNYFYIVRAADSSGNESKNSGHVGEFDIDLLTAP
jgi:hypothetical protein